MANRLALSSSLYLRQHGDNPIDWFEWGDEALEKAKREQKPIFLSVGYSSCHWCHVMAHETFEDPEVAKVLNESFVSIKVDREERPDIDEAYMIAVQLQAGRGGWPMSLFLVPQGEPILAGTYFPKLDRPPMPGFLSVATQIALLWKEKPDDLLQMANEFGSQVRAAMERDAPLSYSALDYDFLEGCVAQIGAEFDSEQGGFGTAPKFPPHSVLTLLIECARCSGLKSQTRSECLEMAVKTLEAMSLGGIHDAIGGGFHRYSVDGGWRLPHFEKMLYDNALLMSNYAKAAKLLATTQPERSKSFLRVADRILAWMDRELMSEEGLVGSALDADINGEEGSTYLWTEREVAQVLGSNAETFSWVYQFEQGGNFFEEATGLRTGANVLHRRSASETVPDEWLDQLLQARNLRPQPMRDDKQLASWNGLVIQALLDLDLPERAERLASSWLAIYEREGGLPHFVADGKAHGAGYLDDYAHMSLAWQRLASLFPEIWSAPASKLASELVDRFADRVGFAFYGSDQSHWDLFGRIKPVFDQPIPSGNAAALMALGHDPNWKELVASSLQGLIGWMERAPQACAALLTASLGHLKEYRDGTESLSMEQPILLRSKVSLTNSEIIAGIDGWAEGCIVIELPADQHIHGPNPPLAWLKPLVVEFKGFVASVEYPDSPDDGLDGPVSIPFAVKRNGLTDLEECQITVRYQPCTDLECLAEQEHHLALLIARPGLG